MNRKYELENIVEILFSYGAEQPFRTADIQKTLDYEALSQALCNDDEIIYRYCTDNSSLEGGCEYRSELLFPQRGTLIYEQIVSIEASVVGMKRVMELWILDDMTLAVVSKVEVIDPEGVFKSQYRTLRTQDFEEIPHEIDLDMETLALKLQDMSEEFQSGGMPFYEL